MFGWLKRKNNKTQKVHSFEQCDIERKCETIPSTVPLSNQCINNSYLRGEKCCLVADHVYYPDQYNDLPFLSNLIQDFTTRLLTLINNRDQYKNSNVYILQYDRLLKVLTSVADEVTNSKSQIICVSPDSSEKEKENLQKQFISLVNQELENKKKQESEQTIVQSDKIVSIPEPINEPQVSAINPPEQSAIEVSEQIQSKKSESVNSPSIPSSFGIPRQNTDIPHDYVPVENMVSAREIQDEHSEQIVPTEDHSHDTLNARDISNVSFEEDDSNTIEHQEDSSGAREIDESKLEQNNSLEIKNAEKEKKLFDKLVDLINEHMRSSDISFTKEDKFFEDIGFDSLDAVEFVMVIEEEFNIEIPDEESEKIKTVGEAIEYLMSRNDVYEKI